MIHDWSVETHLCLTQEQEHATAHDVPAQYKNKHQSSWLHGTKQYQMCSINTLLICFYSKTAVHIRAHFAHNLLNNLHASFPLHLALDIVWQHSMYCIANRGSFPFQLPNISILMIPANEEWNDAIGFTNWIAAWGVILLSKRQCASTFGMFWSKKNYVFQLK